MMHNVQVFPLIGLPQFNGWSQVVIAANKSVVLALAIQGQNAGNIGRDLVTQVQETPVLVAADFYALLQKLLKITQVLEVRLSCAAALVGEDQVAYATYDAKILLKRGSKVGALVSSGPELKLIQGTVTQDDLVVLATNQTQPFHGEIQQKATQGYEAEVIMKSLVTAVHSHPDSASMSLAFMSFEPEEAAPTKNWEMPAAIIPPQPPEITLTGRQELETGNNQSTSFSPESEMPSFSAPLLSTQSNHSNPVATPALVLVFKKLGAFLLKMGKGTGQQLAAIIAKKPWQKIHISRVFVKKNADQPAVYASPSTAYLSGSKFAGFWKILIPLVIVVLLLFGGWRWWRSRRLAQVQAAQLTLQPLLHNFTVAKEQVSQNPVLARDSMQQTISELEVLQKEYEAQPAAQEYVLAQLEEVKTQFQEVSGREEFSELPIFFDLSSIQADFLTNEATGDGNTAIFIDREKQEALSLNMTTKFVKRWPLSSVPAIVDATLNGSKLIFLTQGISELDLDLEAPETTELVAVGDSNREAKLIASYSDFIYLLNPVKRNIYRYLRNEKKLSDPIGWLKPGQSLPYEDIVSFKVDGDVWLSTKDGKILKLSLGEMAEFTTVGLNQAFQYPITLDTREDWQNLYILEPQARRLVVLDKEGRFIKEIKSASLASATHLIANEAQKKVLAVSGSVVFEINL